MSGWNVFFLQTSFSGGESTSGESATRSGVSLGLDRRMRRWSYREKT